MHKKAITEFQKILAVIAIAMIVSSVLLSSDNTNDRRNKVTGGATTDTPDVVFANFLQQSQQKGLSSNRVDGVRSIVSTKLVEARIDTTKRGDFFAIDEQGRAIYIRSGTSSVYISDPKNNKLWTLRDTSGANWKILDTAVLPGPLLSTFVKEYTVKYSDPRLIDSITGKPVVFYGIPGTIATAYDSNGEIRKIGIPIDINEPGMVIVKATDRDLSKINLNYVPPEPAPQPITPTQDSILKRDYNCLL